MRTHRVPLILAIVLLAGGGPALAQTRAAHRVSVTIPSVLRLRLDADAATDRAQVDLAVDVADGVPTVMPGSTTVQLLANGAWDLHVAFSGDAGLGLTAQLDGGRSAALDGRDRVLASGGSTGGWMSTRVRYLAPAAVALADGRYGGTVTYTLTRP